MGICGVSIAHQLPKNFGSSGLRMLQLFKHQHRGPFAHDKTGAIGIKGSRGTLGFIVACAHGFHG